MLCMKTLPAQSLYMEENASLASKWLTLPGFASVFPRGIMHRAVDQRASCDCLFTFSQGKLAAAVCLGLPIQA